MTEWNVERAKDEIANGGRYGAKRVMEAVYGSLVSFMQTNKLRHRSHGVYKSEAHASSLEHADHVVM